MRTSLMALALAGTMTSQLALAAPATYAFDPGHTFVTWEIGHFGTSTNRGRFDKNTGAVVLDKEARTGKVEVTTETASINTGFAPFTAHLQSADLFDVAKYPTMKFVSSKLVFQGDKVTEVVGDLTLLGKTHPVTLKANQFNCYDNPMLKREVCGGDFEATIDRTQWGMNYAVQMGMPKNVRLVIQVEAVKQ